MLACAEIFKNELDSNNLNYGCDVIDANNVNITLPYKGKTANCFFNGDNGEYLSLYLVYEQVPADKIADMIFLCNELNSQYKWVTFYVSKENDLILHDDAILSVESAGREGFELLLRLLNIGETVKPLIMKALYA